MYIKKSILPLMMAELVGTALLVTTGLSIVILFWGDGSVIAPLIPNQAVRRAVTGFLFGTTGCLISISRVGKISGAHINPAVSFAFWLRGKMKTNAMLGYMLSQLTGAAIGAVFLLLWRGQGRSVGYGNTVPGHEGLVAAFAGELLCTAALVTVIFLFAGKKRLRRFTPYTIPFLYCIMVCLESPLSGCSTNPARSFGPALVSGVYTGY